MSMNDSDDSLDLLVRIKGDAAGATVAKDALKDVTKETEKSGDANKEHAKSFLHAESSARGFHQLLHKITEESPLLGSALRMAISPVGGAFMAAAYALNAYKKASEEAAKAAIATAEKNAEPLADMKGAAEAAADAIYTLIEAYKEWAKHGHEVSDQLHAQNVALASNIALINADAAAVKAAAESHKAAALVILEADRAAGRISEGGYQAAKQRIEDQAKETTRATDKKSIEEEIKLREAAAAVAAKQAKDAEEAAKKAQAAALAGAATTEHAAGLKDQAAKAQAKADEAKGKLPAAREERAEWQEAVAHYGLLGSIADYFRGFHKEESGKYPATPMEQKAQDAGKKEDALDKSAREQSEFARRSADEAKRLETAQKAREKAAEKANADADQEREESRKQAEELAKAKARLAALNQVTTATAPSEAFTSTMKTPAGKLGAEDMTEAEATAQALNAHKQASNESRARLIEVASALAGHQVSMQQAVAMMASAASSMGTYTQDVVKLAQVIKGIAEGQSELRSLYRDLAAQVRSRGLNAGG
jgi:hypothetical protein